MSSPVDSLVERRFAVIDSFLDPAALFAEAQNRRAEFRRAGIGKDGRLHDEIRRDEILWLPDSPDSPAQADLHARLSLLKDELNRELFAGLKSFEAHFAIYPAGAFYARHVDRFKADDSRVLSCVLYLNPDWSADDGGALRLHGLSDIVPAPGRLVVFFSDEIEHEVLPARRDRFSVACWLKR